MTNKPLLIILVGFPGSGKSYFAKQLAPKINAVRLNGDSMKTALYGSYEFMRKNNLIFEANKRGFAGMDYAAEEMLRAGFSFIYDANNNKRATRDKLSALAIRNGALPIVVWIRLPESVAKERAITRDKTADQPSFDAELFDEVVKRQAANFDIPDPAENLIEVNGEVPFDEQYTYFNNALQQLRDA